MPQHEAEDLTGVPCHVIINGKKATQFAPIEIFHSEEPFILFLDEISAAEPRTQKVLLQLINEHMIAGVKLAPGVLIMLAGNIAGDRANLKKVSFPLGNRCAHYNFENTYVSWLKWAEQNGVCDEFLAWVRWKKSDGIHAYNEDHASLAQLTPRSLYHSSLAWREAIDLEVDRFEQESAVISNIGTGSGTELCTFLDLRTQLASWGEIVNGPKSAKLPKANRFDHIYFTVSMLIGNLRNPELSDKATESAATYCSRLLEECHGCADALTWLVDDICKMAHMGGKKLDKKSLQVQKILKAFEVNPDLSAKVLEFYSKVEAA